MKTNEIVKLDVAMLEPFDTNEMLVVRGGGLKEAAKKILDTLGAVSMVIALTIAIVIVINVVNNFLHPRRLSYFDILYQNGFIIDDDIDEKELYKNLYYEKKYNRNTYFLIINPTLNCNLGCWYCYENHKEQSELNEDTITRILLHIKQKQELDKFSHLGISFFGGEPMLKPKIITELLNKINDLTTEKQIKLSVSFITNATILPTLEQGKNVRCKLDSDFTKNDYIIHNLNRQLLTNKINAL
ncbi:hypothetical protein FACS189413_17390 [Bacteroidia bacterium]|nr:hypothetical protein FACS189463_1530 [Bacteroidia bacterium]GHU73236.1 hypothetical protein FACS189413_17390 [Bacteroidia bacterium]